MDLRKRLYRFYWRLEKMIFPALRSSQYVYYEALKYWLPPGCRWLDLGCGHQVFASWMRAEELDLINRSQHVFGVDLDVDGMKKHQSIHNRMVGNLECLPFPDASMEMVTANMVVEHLERPDQVLQEIRRVLRPRGVFIYHTPNVRSLAIGAARATPQWLKDVLIHILEGRKDEDVFKTFYRMNTPEDVRRMASEAGFELVDLHLANTSALTAMLGPAAIIELFYLRLLTMEKLARYRSNITAVLRRS